MGAPPRRAHLPVPHGLLALGPPRRLRLRLRGRRCAHQPQAEVSQLRVAVRVKEHVCRLYVPVDHVVRVKVRQGTRHLGRDLDALVPWQQREAARGRLARQVVIQAASAHELVHERLDAVIIGVAQQPHHVRVLQLRWHGGGRCVGNGPGAHTLHSKAQVDPGRTCCHPPPPPHLRQQVALIVELSSSLEAVLI